MTNEVNRALAAKKNYLQAQTSVTDMMPSVSLLAGSPTPSPTPEPDYQVDITGGGDPLGGR